MTLKIAFIGLGNMGGGMAANQAKAGNAVAAFDLSQAALDRAKAAGCAPVGSVAEAVKDADVVITMLPAGPHVLKVYSEQIIGAAPTSALLLDCATLGVDTARQAPGPALASRFAGRGVSTTAELDSLFAEERRCPRCGGQLFPERRQHLRRKAERRGNRADVPGPPGSFERRVKERRRTPRRRDDGKAF